VKAPDACKGAFGGFFGVQVGPVSAFYVVVDVFSTVNLLVFLGLDDLCRD
jgi:hypothetical protein